VAQKPRPMPRVVRLGRPANDNARRTRFWVLAVAVALTTALVMAVLYNWQLI